MSSLSGLQLDRLQDGLRIPEVLGDRYRLLSLLGRGGMGVVYLAQDTRLDRRVALKVIDPALASEELEARLEQEARILGRLSHPGIVPIHDLGREADLTLFYVMKHVDGETLEHWLPAHVSRTERLRLFEKLCEPVAFAHAQGIAHQDLKPTNVMIGAFGEVLVMDWGLACRLDAATSERAVAADLHALGAMLLFLLTDRHSPADTGAARLERRLDRRLDAICTRATQPQAHERYATVGELAADVLRYLDGEAVHAYRERWYEHVARWIKRHQLVLALIVMYLAMRVIVAFVRQTAR